MTFTLQIYNSNRLENILYFQVKTVLAHNYYKENMKKNQDYFLLHILICFGFLWMQQLFELHIQLNLGIFFFQTNKLKLIAQQAGTRGTTRSEIHPGTHLLWQALPHLAKAFLTELEFEVHKTQSKAFQPNPFVFLFFSISTKLNGSGYRDFYFYLTFYLYGQFSSIIYIFAAMLKYSNCDFDS